MSWHATTRNSSELIGFHAVRTTFRIISAIAFIISSLGLIGGVLLHSGRGGGLSDMFGGASGASLGSTSAERNLTRITTVCAVCWIFSVIALGMFID
jgi:preprotein translocase subunit SecG